MKKVAIYYILYFLASVLVFFRSFCPPMGSGGFFPLWELTVILTGPINYMLMYLAFPFYFVFTFINFSLVMRIHTAHLIKTKAIMVVVTIFLWLMMGWLALGNVLFF